MRRDFPPVLRHAQRAIYAALYIFAVVFMLARFAELRSPEVGYAWLPRFGAHFHERKSEEFKQTRHLITSEYGYDGQFYAQLALDPTLSDPATKRAVDNPIFRARRILFSATAYVAGGGDPDRALQAYSAQNIAFWLLTALLLLYWLPPTNWQNALRYLALLYTAGLVNSLTHALLDGPAMALVLLGILLAERRRDTAGALVLGLAGLGKETSIFAASGLGLPGPRDRRAVAAWMLRLAIVAAPLLAWFLYLRSQVDSSKGSIGARNFDWPLAGWWEAAERLVGRIGTEGWLPYNYLTVLFLAALPIQALCILARPQLKSLWWRVGAVYAAFSLVLGFAVWEGVVGAAARVVLPLTFAFNILHPRGLRWLPLLILGNALAFVGARELLETRAPRLETSLGTDFQSRLPLDGRPYPAMAFGNGWYPEERDGDRVWRWTSGDAELRFDNPTDAPAAAVLSLSLHTRAPRTVVVQSNGIPVATYECALDSRQSIELRAPLARGPNIVRFRTLEPPITVPGDPRDLAFAIEDYRFRVE